MADPSYVIEQAVKIFYHHWHCGLQPSINLKTLPNGAVCVSSNATIIPPNSQIYEHISSSYSTRHRSGRNSRKKRRNKRFQSQVLHKESNESFGTEEQSESKASPKPAEASQNQSLKVNANEVACQAYPVINSTLDQPKNLKADTAVQAVQEMVDAACEAASFLSSHSQKNLSISRCTLTNIPPRPIYHPAIINASIAFFKKHPSELSEEEVAKFKCYLQRKKELGEPVETDVIYQPSSPRDCLHCGHPT